MIISVVAAKIYGISKMRGFYWATLYGLKTLLLRITLIA